MDATATPAFNPADPAFLADPLSVYRHLRDTAPVQHIAIGDGLWLVTRYDDVRQLVRRPDGLMRPPGSRVEAVLGDGPAARIHRNLMVLNDPPKHTRLRMLAQRALTPVAVENLRLRAEEVVDTALQNMQQRGEADAVLDLAFAVPYHVICGMLGIPEDRRQELLRWTPDFFRIFLPEANDADGVQACNDSCQFFIDYLGEQIEARRRSPGEDIFSALITAEEEGERLDRDELIATVLALLTGGFDTTMGMISAGVYNLARDPAQLALLRRAPEEHARSCVEETVRWESPVGTTYRYFTQDVRVADVTIPAGEAVWMPLLSANHDERRFDDPEGFAIDRARNEHVGFGGSRHFCIGQHLAKLEGEVTFSRLARRFRALEIVEEPRRRPNFQFRSFETLKIRCTPA